MWFDKLFFAGLASCAAGGVMCIVAIGAGMQHRRHERMACWPDPMRTFQDQSGALHVTNSFIKIHPDDPGAPAVPETYPRVVMKQ